jgi:transcriptional regulator with XRE-family HTH domain
MTSDRAALLRELRLRSGHTQAEAAELCHVTRRAWQFWEAGDRAVDEAALHLYCLLVGVPYEPPPADDGA